MIGDSESEKLLSLIVSRYGSESQQSQDAVALAKSAGDLLTIEEVQARLQSLLDTGAAWAQLPAQE